MSEPGKLIFRPFMREDRAAIIELLAGGRPVGYSAEKSRFFDWQFLQAPAFKGEDPFIVGTVSDEIVACNGFMPVSIRFEGTPIAASWSCDTYVSSAYRGRGFGKELLGRVSQRSSVMLGFGISDLSDPILAKLGWVLDDSTRCMFYTVREPGIRGLLKRLRTVATGLRGTARGESVSTIAFENRPFGDEVDSLWQRIATQYPFAVERSQAYLEWRFRRHPSLKYRVLSARRAGELCALVITRHHPKESVLADYVGPTDDAGLLGSVFDAAVSDLKSIGTSKIRCETTHPALVAALARQGFVASRYKSRFRVRTNLSGDGASSTGSWLLLTADSDNDMLVLS